MHSKSKAKLQIYLLKRGVYITTHNNRYTLLKILFDILQEKEPYEWTDKELIAALIEAKPIIIITLQERLNPKLDILTVVSHTPKSAQPTATTLSGTQTPVSTPPPQQSIPQQATPTATQQQAAPTSTQNQLLTLLT